MTFKLKNPYDMRLMNTSVSHIDDDINVLGRTTSAGNITLSKNIPSSHIKSVIRHELGHTDDVKNGDLGTKKTGHHTQSSCNQKGDRN